QRCALPILGRLHPPADAVAAEEETGADLVHCGARQYRRMRIPRPSVGSNLAASQHLSVEERPVRTYDLAKFVPHPAKHRLAFEIQRLWIVEGIQHRRSVRPYLI